MAIAAFFLLALHSTGTRQAVAQEPAPAQPAKKRPGFVRPAPPPDDAQGFEAIFDGKTLTNWDGDPVFWRAEDGVLVGESTPEKVVKQNTFIIWRGGVTRDFELKLEFRLSAAANSGVQYRSVTVPEAGSWAMKGYQADMDGQHTFTGMLYEERGRGFLAPRGQFARMAAGRTLKLIGSPGASDELRALLKSEDWNSMHVIAFGNMMTHVINGRVMAMLIDEDTQGRAMEGLLGFQLHVGPPMKVEFRNILFKKL